MNRLFLLACCVFATIGIPLIAINNMPLIAQLQGEHNASKYGFTLDTLDFNHDGTDDLLVFSFSYGYHWNQTPPRGKAYIYYGGTEFNSTAEAALTMEGDYPNGEDRCMEGAINCGDVSGDGFDDLLLIYHYQNIDYKYSLEFYYGQTEDLLSPDMVIVTQGYEYHQEFVKLGDVDGDGYDDVGYVPWDTSCRHTILWGGSFQSQAVHVMPINHMSGAFISGVGDINNDGLSDFSIAYIFETQPIYDNFIKLYYGSSSRVFAEPDTLIHTSTPITLVTKPLGDINADGVDDFFGYSDQYSMRIWYGGVAFDVNNPDLLIAPPLFGDVFASGISAGDVNNDGYSDIVGASYAQERFKVWLGNASVDTDYDFMLGNDYDQFGYDVSTGDYNADGYCDVAVSAPREYGEYPLHDYRGYVFVYGGNAEMVANEDELAPQLQDQWQFSSFPNPLPAGKKLSLRYLGKGYAQPMTKNITLYNLKGQRVFQTQDSSRGETSSISLPELPSGVYILSISEGTTRLSCKRILVY